MNEKLLRAEEVAERLSISESYAYQMMRCGDIPTVRMGRAVRVREQDLEEFIAKNVEPKTNSIYSKFSGDQK